MWMNWRSQLVWLATGLLLAAALGSCDDSTGGTQTDAVTLDTEGDVTVS